MLGTGDGPQGSTHSCVHVADRGCPLHEGLLGSNKESLIVNYRL